MIIFKPIPCLQATVCGGRNTNYQHLISFPGERGRDLPHIPHQLPGTSLVFSCVSINFTHFYLPSLV